MENRIEEVVYGNQRRVYKGTNTENLLNNATNKGWDRCVRFCSRSILIIEAWWQNMVLSCIL